MITTLLQFLPSGRALKVGIVAGITVLLISCGGAGGNTVALPGTGGTGIMASGPISGFGSVVINGIRFEDAAAQVTIDGTGTTSTELRLGMVAQVEGTKSDAIITPTAVITAAGDAKHIEVWSIAQGSISQISSSNSFTVSGMNMLVDAGSVLQGVMSANLLGTSTLVKVWGQAANADSTLWSVTRLEVLNTASTTISTGKVSVINGTPSLNGYKLTGTTSGLQDGQLVRLTGTVDTQLATRTLSVSSIKIFASTPSALPTSGYAELQGIVTSVSGTGTKAAQITLGPVIVDLSLATVKPSAAQIKVGARVEVEGNWNAGLLIAKQIEVKSSQEQLEVEIEGVIEQFTSISNFTVRGQLCDAAGLTRVGNGTLANLRKGLKVHLHGFKNGDVVRVTELEINN
jgi:hypothetical protein